MAFDSDGLSDFGTGAFAGATTGATIGSAGGPMGTAIGAGVGALAGGTLSYFGGAGNRKLEKKHNKVYIRGMEQDLELGELNISEARRNRSKSIDAERKKKMFGEMLAQYFQKQGAV